MMTEAKWRFWAVAALGAVAILGALLVEPIPQDPGYHDFADVRQVFTIPNTWDVLSNVPFVLVGILGLAVVWALKQTMGWAQVWPYLVLYMGAILTGLGSAYYHLSPYNETLVWDRLGMVVAFMGFFCSVVSEAIDRRLGNYLLVPMLAIGIFSVWYWIHTEQTGGGDLRWYGLVQFLPMALIPLILYLYRPPWSYTRAVLCLGGFYMLAKVFEFFDKEIFALGGLVSGHTLKHVAAAVGLLCLVPWLLSRRRLHLGQT